jgi:hypothetical protein
MEIWKPVPSLEEFYEISNLGNIRSLIRKGFTSYGERTYGGKLVKHFISSNGYPCVNLTTKNFRKQYLIHRLVLETFVGKCPDGMEGCHNDGNRKNYVLSNLRWDTRSNNALDKRKHGTWQGGENANGVKLTTDEAIYIKYSKESCNKLAKKFKIGATTVSRIKSGKSWIHI